LFDQARVPRRHHPIASAEQQNRTKSRENLKAEVVSAHFSCSTSLIVKPSRAQIFVAIAVLSAPLMSIFSQASASETYRINFSDVDGNALSTADGHITIVVLVNKANIDKARAVGDRIPDFCLVNPMYRMITVLA